MTNNSYLKSSIRCIFQLHETAVLAFAFFVCSILSKMKPSKLSEETKIGTSLLKHFFKIRHVSAKFMQKRLKIIPWIMNVILCKPAVFT